MWNDLKRYAQSFVAFTSVKREEGQALVEYSLILGLISVIAIAALTTIGTEVLAKLEAVATAL
jgi:Flp pilus assembly pilin Flp